MEHLREGNEWYNGFILPGYLKEEEGMHPLLKLPEMEQMRFILAQGESSSYLLQFLNLLCYFSEKKNWRAFHPSLTELPDNWGHREDDMLREEHLTTCM